MTVPFNPGGVDPGPDFLSTLSRSFLQARNLVEDDAQRRRAKERFATEQERMNLDIERTRRTMALEDEDRAIAEAKDPTVLRPEQVGGTPDELAQALETGVEEIPGTDLYYDPFGGQERQQVSQQRDIDFLASEIDRQADALQENDPVAADELRASKPEAIRNMLTGRKPSNYDVSGRIEVERERQRLRLAVTSQLQQERGQIQERLARINTSTREGQQELDLVNAQFRAITTMIQLGVAARPTKASSLAEILEPGSSAQTREAIEEALNTWQSATAQLERLQARRGRGTTTPPPSETAEGAGKMALESQEDYDMLIADGMTPEEIAEAFDIPDTIQRR